MKSNASPAQRRLVGMTGAVALVLALVAPRVYGQVQVRFGVVNVERAIEECNEGREGLGLIKQYFGRRQGHIDARTRVLEGLKRTVENPRLPVPRRQAAAREYYQRAMELQQLGQQFTQEVQQLEYQLGGVILQKMQPIIRQVGQSGSFQVLVDERVVHYAPMNINMTDQVIQLYNQAHPDGSVFTDAAALLAYASEGGLTPGSAPPAGAMGAPPGGDGGVPMGLPGAGGGGLTPGLGPAAGGVGLGAGGGGAAVGGGGGPAVAPPAREAGAPAASGGLDAGAPAANQGAGGAAVPSVFLRRDR